MYQLIKDYKSNQVCVVNQTIGNIMLSIPLFDPTNMHYQKFKDAIIKETTQLKDADGNTMTAAEAKAFVATLP